VKTIQAEVPDQLFRQVDALVKQGWFRDHDDVIQQALHRFVESHRPELMERFVLQDVEWGLRGGK
jgi:Arc/MetJ-type ribon-helix-helix transcriptional regulator